MPSHTTFIGITTLGTTVPTFCKAFSLWRIPLPIKADFDASRPC
jgi:hypothetical protein